MRFIAPTSIILTEIDADYILKLIELAGRTCYKSEDKITLDSAKEFARKILKRGHESVIEHAGVTVKFYCDRGVSHELVRHRLCAFSQESTRYCDYLGGVSYIEPPWELDESDKALLGLIEQHYQKKLKQGQSPQQARYFLPNGLKTEIVTTCNLREWRHIFKLRTAKAAHPQMREIMRPLLDEFKEQIPVIFDDITYTD